MENIVYGFVANSHKRSPHRTDKLINAI